MIGGSEQSLLRHPVVSSESTRDPFTLSIKKHAAPPCSSLRLKTNVTQRGPADTRPNSTDLGYDILLVPIVNTNACMLAQSILARGLGPTPVDTASMGAAA